MPRRLRPTLLFATEFFFWAVLLSAPRPGARSRQCGTSPLYMEHEGLTRQAELYTPAQACNDDARRKVPLLLLLHCNGCRTEWGLLELELAADSLGWLLLMPRGVGKSWNAGECCGKAAHENIDDLGFLRRLLVLAVTDLGGQRDAIFIAGFSNGAYMTTMLASASEVSIRGFAAIGGYSYNISQLRTQGAASILHLSHDDDAVLYNGCCAGAGCCCNIDLRRGAAPCFGGDAAAEALRRSSDCTFFPEVHIGNNVVCHAGRGCSASTVFCAWRGKRHLALGTKKFLCGAMDFLARSAELGSLDASTCERLGLPASAYGVILHTSTSRAIDKITSPLLLQSTAVQPESIGRPWPWVGMTFGFLGIAMLGGTALVVCVSRHRAYEARCRGPAGQVIGAQRSELINVDPVLE